MLSLLGLASAFIVPVPYVSPAITPYKFPAYQPAVVPYSVVANPIAPGYVAKTRGAEHYAPLPEGLAYASHHINVNPAPGTV